MLDLSFFNLQFEILPEELAFFKFVFKVPYYLHLLLNDIIHLFLLLAGLATAE